MSFLLCDLSELINAFIFSSFNFFHYNAAAEKFSVNAIMSFMVLLT